VGKRKRDLIEEAALAVSSWCSLARSTSGDVFADELSGSDDDRFGSASPFFVVEPRVADLALGGSDGGACGDDDLSLLTLSSSASTVASSA